MTIHINFKAIITLFVVLALIVGGWFAYESTRYSTYEIIVQKPVSGLVGGAPVEFNGVVVGKIAKLSFNRQDPQKLYILVSILKSTPITQGTKASVDLSEIITQKYTGFPYAYISLLDQGQNMQPIVTITGETYPRIVLVQNGESKPALKQLSQTLAQTHSLLEPLFAEENIESLTQLIYSLQQVASVLAAKSDKLDSILDNADKASKQVDPFLQSGKGAMNTVQATMQTLQTQTLPKMYHLMNNLNNTLLMMRELASKISNNPSIMIRGEATPELGPGERH